MITSGELKLISIVISLLSRLGVLPVDVDVSTYKLSKLTMMRQAWRWLCFTVCAMHLAYANYRFVTLYLIGDPVQVPAYVYVFHLSYSFLLTLHLMFNVLMSYGKQELLIQVFNRIQGKSVVIEQIKSLTCKLKMDKY